MALNGLAHQVSKVMENEADSRRKVFGEVRQEAKWGEMSSRSCPAFGNFEKYKGLKARPGKFVERALKCKSGCENRITWQRQRRELQRRQRQQPEQRRRQPER